MRSDDSIQQPRRRARVSLPGCLAVRSLFYDSICLYHGILIRFLCIYLSIYVSIYMGTVLEVRIGGTGDRIGALSCFLYSVY